MELFNFEEKKEKAVEPKTEKKAYHVTIRDNETGEVIHDSETDAFICAYKTDGATKGCSGLRTDPFSASGVVMAAEGQIKKLLRQHQELAFLISIEKALKEKTEESDER